MPLAKNGKSNSTKRKYRRLVFMIFRRNDLLLLHLLLSLSLSLSFFKIGMHLRYMEVPRLGVESELQLLAYTIATARSKPQLGPTSQLMAMLDP